MSDEKQKAAGADSFITDTREELKKQKKHRIMIPSTEKDKDPVQVGINGYVYNIPRDTEVEVPAGVLEVLENAVMKSYTVRKREVGEGNELVGQDVRRFPYQSVR
jgi:hypothetical protein